MLSRVRASGHPPGRPLSRAAQYRWLQCKGYCAGRATTGARFFLLAAPRSSGLRVGAAAGQVVAAVRSVADRLPHHRAYRRRIGIGFRPVLAPCGAQAGQVAYWYHPAPAGASRGAVSANRSSCRLIEQLSSAGRSYSRPLRKWVPSVRSGCRLHLFRRAAPPHLASGSSRVSLETITCCAVRQGGRSRRPSSGGSPLGSPAGPPPGISRRPVPAPCGSAGWAGGVLVPPGAGGRVTGALSNRSSCRHGPVLANRHRPRHRLHSSTRPGFGMADAAVRRGIPHAVRTPCSSMVGVMPRRRLLYPAADGPDLRSARLADVAQPSSWPVTVPVDTPDRIPRRSRTRIAPPSSGSCPASLRSSPSSLRCGARPEQAPLPSCTSAALPQPAPGPPAPPRDGHARTHVAPMPRPPRSRRFR